MNTTCPICYRDCGEDDTTTSTISECNHVMCRTCFLEFTVNRGYSKCPLCRNLICPEYVTHAIGNRPFTRNLLRCVHNGVFVWFSRALSHRLRENITSERISHMLFLELDEIFTDHPEVFSIVRADVLPVIHHAMMYHS